MTLMGNSQASMGGIQLKHFPKHSLLKESLHLNSERLIESIIILPVTPFDEVEAAYMISRVDQLPKSLLSKMDKEGIRLKLFEGKLTDNPTANHLSGLTPRGYVSNKVWDDVPGIGGTKTVLAKIGHSARGKGHGSVNLELHELAHSIDRHVYKDLRYNQKYLKIWNDEKHIVFPNRNYFLTFPEEYFAEAFAMYYIGGEHRAILQELAPKTYNFIKDLK